MLKNKKNKKKILIIVAVAGLLLLAGGFAVYKATRPEKTEVPLGGVNYDPPTDAEKQETEEFKKNQQDEANNQSSNPASGRQAGVVITYLTPDEARGYATGVVEDGGTCTLTLTKGSAKVSFTSSGIGDVNKTTCGVLAFDRSKLSAGDWTAVLSYSSGTISGSSTSQTLKVP